VGVCLCHQRRVDKGWLLASGRTGGGLGCSAACPQGDRCSGVDSVRRDLGLVVCNDACRDVSVVVQPRRGGARQLAGWLGRRFLRFPGRVPVMASSRLRRSVAFVFISILIGVIAAPFRLQGPVFVAVAVFGAVIPFVVLMRLWPDDPDAPWRIWSTLGSSFERGSVARAVLVFLGITAFALITAFHPQLWWPIVISSAAIYLVVRRRKANSSEAGRRDILDDGG